MEAVPLAFALKSHNCFFLSVSCIFLASIPPPEPRVSACKLVSLCMSPLRVRLVSSSLLPHPDGWPESSLIFTVRCFGGSSSQHVALGWGAPCRDRTPRSSVETSAAEISLPFLSCHLWIWDQLILHLQSSYQF